MYQGLGQMLTKCLQHHQGYPETPKSADVICEWPLKVFKRQLVFLKGIFSEYCNLHLNEECISKMVNMAYMSGEQCAAGAGIQHKY